MHADLCVCVCVCVALLVSDRKDPRDVVPAEYEFIADQSAVRPQRRVDLSHARRANEDEFFS